MQHDDFLNLVRQRIKRLRTEKNLRQEDMAEKLNWNLRYYQRFEGNTQEQFNPKIRMFLQIADALGVTLEHLFASEDVASVSAELAEKAPQRITRKRRKAASRP